MGRSWISSFRIPVSMFASLMILVFAIFMIAVIIARFIMGVELKKLTSGLKNFSTFHKRAGTNHTHSGVAGLEFITQTHLTASSSKYTQEILGFKTPRRSPKFHTSLLPTRTLRITHTSRSRPAPACKSTPTPTAILPIIVSQPLRFINLCPFLKACLCWPFAA
jgi:hypothetical protein